MRVRASARAVSGGREAMAGGRRPGDVEMEELDARAFARNAAMAFGGMSAALYPLSVVKTNAMAQPDGSGSSLGAARSLLKQSALAPWRGFGTVLLGMLPSRTLYLSTLETGRSRLRRSLTSGPLRLSPSVSSALADAVSAGAASVVSQCVSVPIDVIAQRQMVASSALPASSVLRDLLRSDGPSGLWRGFGPSLLTVSFSSALWWGCYSSYQSAFWRLMPPTFRQHISAWESSGRSGVAPNSLIGLQACSGFTAGLTSGALTCPVDVIKVRLQTKLRSASSNERPSLSGTINELYSQDGLRGFARGLPMRMSAAALWGSVAISLYEIVKRRSVA